MLNKPTSRKEREPSFVELAERIAQVSLVFIVLDCTTSCQDVKG